MAPELESREAGEALAFDSAGNMYRRLVGDRRAFVLGRDGKLDIRFAPLRQIKMSDPFDVRSLLVREEEAEEVVEAITDHVQRNLVQLCITTARMRLIRWNEQTEEQWKKALPSAPVDMAFLAEALSSALKTPEVLRAILDGQSIAQATGWDID